MIGHRRSEVPRKLHLCTIDADEMADFADYLFCPVLARVRPRELQEPSVGFSYESHPVFCSRASRLTSVSRELNIHDGVGIVVHSRYGRRASSPPPTLPTGAQPPLRKSVVPMTGLSCASDLRASAVRAARSARGADWAGASPSRASRRSPRAPSPRFLRSPYASSRGFASGASSCGRAPEVPASAPCAQTLRSRCNWFYAAASPCRSTAAAQPGVEPGLPARRPFSELPDERRLATSSRLRPRLVRPARHRAPRATGDSPHGV